MIPLMRETAFTVKNAMAEVTLVTLILRKYEATSRLAL